MNLILVDNNTSKLDEAKSMLSSTKAGNVDTHSMDVASLSDWNKLKSHVESLDFLHLNAGIGPKGDWTNNEVFHQIMDVSTFTLGDTT